MDKSSQTTIQPMLQPNPSNVPKYLGEFLMVCWALLTILQLASPRRNEPLDVQLERQLERDFSNDPKAEHSHSHQNPLAILQALSEDSTAPQKFTVQLNGKTYSVEYFQEMLPADINIAAPQFGLFGKMAIIELGFKVSFSVGSKTVVVKDQVADGYIMVTLDSDGKPRKDQNFDPSSSDLEKIYFASDSPRTVSELSPHMQGLITHAYLEVMDGVWKQLKLHSKIQFPKRQPEQPNRKQEQAGKVPQISGKEMPRHAAQLIAQRIAARTKAARTKQQNAHPFQQRKI